MCHAILLGKAGRKGGDVRFERTKSHIVRLLRQQSTTFVSTMFDYFRIEPTWPGRVAASAISSPQDKAVTCETEMVIALQQAIGGDNRVQQRFLPYIEMHEFEALLFSDPEQLAMGLNVGVFCTSIQKQQIFDSCWTGTVCISIATWQGGSYSRTSRYYRCLSVLGCSVVSLLWF